LSKEAILRSIHYVSDLLTAVQTHNLYLTLLTLLFSYCYDSRTTQHEPTTESPWTISILTPAFSALDPPPYDSNANEASSAPDTFASSEIISTLVPSFRRSLSFPLFRSFTLADECRKDVGRLLSRGKRTIFRCLLEMKDILDHHEVYYIYSKIWVADFCVWIQAYARCVVSSCTKNKTHV
jgi:protein SHQ1